MCVFSSILSYSDTQDSTVTFTPIIPFEKSEFCYALSVVSDSSIWYTTNKGVFHFDGNHSRKELEVSAFTHSLLEVLLIDALADDNVWVIGHDAKSWKKTMYHFNGKKWKGVVFPQASSDPNDDLVIHKLKMFKRGTTTYGCAVGQDGLTYIYDGTRWSIASRFTEQTLRAMEYRSPDDIWVGGKNGAIFHFNGKIWQQSIVDSIASKNYFFCMNFSGDQDAWAAGQYGLAHFDGQQWHAVSLSTSTPVNAIKMISMNDGWLITAEGAVFHYDGTQWIAIKQLASRTGFNSLGVSRVQGAFAVYVATTSGIMKSYRGKIPNFVDFSASSNIHLYGGTALTADFDGNGTQDLFMTASTLYPDRLYSNRGDGFFSEMTEHLHSVDESFGYIATIADIDNNGLPDIYMMNGLQKDVWYRNMGGWKFRKELSPVSITAANGRNIAQFADMDNDGDLDLVYLRAVNPQQSLTMSVYYNDGIGNFPDSVNFGLPLRLGANTFSFFLADLNNDGRMDVFKYNYGDRSELYLNNGDRTFSEVATSSGIDGRLFEETPVISFACPIDINHDGANDVFLVSRKGEAVFFMNDGHGKFSPGESITFDSQGENPVATFVDIDNDGDQELYMLGQFYKDDHGKFSPYPNIHLEASGMAEFSDIDGDGDDDMFIQSLKERGRGYVFKNEYNPSNIATVSLKGIASNTFGIGARVTLNKRNNDGTSTCVDEREVSATKPILFSLSRDSRYSLDATFPNGNSVHRDNIVPGKMEITEYPFPASMACDFLYSFRRSIQYASIPVEIVKLGIALLFLIGLLNIPFAKGVRSFLVHPLFIGSLITVYVLTIHATIRQGILFSGIVSISGFVLLSVGSLVVAKVIVDKRRANYVSHYKILDLLGAGGMGKVYKAIDVNTKETVALKVLNPTLLQDPENRKRLMSEGHLLSSFSHPNILKVYEVGEIEGTGFIAMEFLSGGTLKQLLDRSYPLPNSELKRLVLQVCSGLKEIHAHNVIHRDLKTANIMLDGEENVRIMDFGLSKSPLVTTMTTLGTVIGTLGYVAPEQVTGMHIDQRVDIFSFGVVLYELFTQQLPFKGENEIAVIHSIFNTIPPTPSSLNPEVTPSMDGIIARCLAKNPDERFRTVEEVRFALEKEFS